MAHDSQKRFCLSVKQRFPDKFNNCDVLDVGSMDINGNNRYLFGGNYTYIGLDLGPGNNVDVVSKGHEYKPGKQFDVVVSTECFEHDPFWKETLANCVALTKSGGVFLFTCAYYCRAEHGTAKSGSPEAAPHVVTLFGDYYKNLGEKEIEEALDLKNLFAQYECSHEAGDLRFWGIKK
jgi:SAM-dependent methyltransferase